jgi:hypothetical protein
MYICSVNNCNLLKSFDIIKSSFKALPVSLDSINSLRVNDTLEVEYEVYNGLKNYKNEWVLNFEKELKHNKLLIPNTQYLSQLNNWFSVYK